MKRAICHYSFHRRCADENWTPHRLVQEVKALGVEGIDFHGRLVGGPPGAADRIRSAMKGSGLALSSLSLGTNFNVPKKEDLQAHMKEVSSWLDVALEIKAPVCRIFGGGLVSHERSDPAAHKAAWQRMLDGVAAAAQEAKRRNVLLALENHGGLPCTGEEQVEVIRAVNSPHLRACIDVGNYMGGGQEGHVGTAIAAPYAAYVHFKDNKKVPDPSMPWGWKIEACVIGEGDVDLAACVDSLRKAGYTGYVGLEYEGPEDETTGVPRSVETLKRFVN